MTAAPMRVVDSHTGGEPTRVVVAGGPDLGTGTLAERRDVFARRFDHVRTALIGEPRSSAIVVGALLVPPIDPAAVAGVVFFNNVGTLGMCGHGTIGVAVTLGYLGRIAAGRHTLETPVGPVKFAYDGRHGATFENVPSYRARAGVSVTLEDGETVVGDVAWGGNWFFLTRETRLPIGPAAIPDLTARAARIRRALDRSGLTGSDGGVIDHIELTAPLPAEASTVDTGISIPAVSGEAGPVVGGRCFVLCPGGEYDRSPCGTGTSAKLACLAADGKLAPGQPWVQESVIGSRFLATYWEATPADRSAANVPADAVGVVVPWVDGRAFVTLDATVVLDDEDPFVWGLTAASRPTEAGLATGAMGVLDGASA